MAQHSEFSDIVTGVLADNTAQSVLNHLKALESNRAHVRTRWIWELLQNARDASVGSNGRLVASVEQSKDKITFQHNGDNFSLEEIAHLIYHGSTKVENEGTIGQYGSGFLATHLLSPEIDVSGRIEDGRRFDFRLRRELGSVGELSKSMQQAADDFERSLSQNTTQDSFTTEFRYPLLSDVSEVVEVGIAALKKCAPFVVAFNPEFSVVRINTPSGRAEFSVTERTFMDQTRFESVTVSENGRWRSEEAGIFAGTRRYGLDRHSPGIRGRRTPVLGNRRHTQNVPWVSSDRHRNFQLSRCSQQFQVYACRKSRWRASGTE